DRSGPGSEPRTGLPARAPPRAGAAGPTTGGDRSADSLRTSGRRSPAERPRAPRPRSPDAPPEPAAHHLHRRFASGPDLEGGRALVQQHAEPAVASPLRAGGGRDEGRAARAVDEVVEEAPRGSGVEGEGEE